MACVAVAAAVMLAMAVVSVMAAHDRVLFVSKAVVEDVVRCSVFAACQRTFWLCAVHAPTSRV